MNRALPSRTPFDMNVRSCICRTIALCGLAALSACDQQVAARKQVGLYRVFDLFQPEDLKDKVTPENAGWKRMEWQAQDMTPLPASPKVENGNSAPSGTPLSAIRFESFNDLKGVTTNQGQLVGESTGAAPILHLALKENRGGAGSVKFIEMRMRVSQAKQIWLRTEGGASIDPEAITQWASQTNSWKTSADVVEDKVQTYRFELSSGRGP